MLPKQRVEKPPPEAGPAEWLDQSALQAMEPSLSQRITGGWWYPLETVWKSKLQCGFNVHRYDPFCQ